MSSYIENYGFAKTYVNNNNKVSNKSIQWEGNYDGDKAFINMDINNNGDNKHVSFVLNKDELMNLLEVQSTRTGLDKRLEKDFLQFSKHKSRKNTKRRMKRNKRNKRKSIRHKH
jgi:hypothetical protein